MRARIFSLGRRPCAAFMLSRRCAASDVAGTIETCKSSPIAQGPLQIAAGGRAYAFLYAEPGSSAVSVLVVPFEE